MQRPSFGCTIARRTLANTATGLFTYSQKHMLVLAAAVATYFMYKQHKVANVLNDRYPMAYKS